MTDANATRIAWCRANKDKVRSYRLNAYARRRTPEGRAKRVIELKIRGERIRRFVCDYLAQHPCVDCGEKDICCLDFDHRAGETKKCLVAYLLRFAASRIKIMAEIEKCEVRCANCHRRRHAKERNWYKYRYSVDTMR